MDKYDNDDVSVHPSQSPAFAANLYENIPAIAAILDEMGIILALSRAATDKFGTDASRLVGRSILSLTHREDRPQIIKAIRNALQDRSHISHFEFRVWRGDSPALKLRTSLRAATPDTGPAILLAVSSDMTDQDLLEQQLEGRSSELNEMANRLVVAQNQERRRIAADMHDGVGSSLALAKFQVHGLKSLALDEAGHQAVDSAVKTLDEAISALRSLTFSLHSTPLNEQGLDAAIEELGQSLSLHQDLQFTLSSRPRSQRLDPKAREYVYRIIRELLVNVVKHAKARAVKVSIGADNTHLQIAVVDDGIGFSCNNHGTTSGTGLITIRNQIESHGGALSIQEANEGGTRVRISLPFSKIGENST